MANRNKTRTQVQDDRRQSRVRIWFAVIVLLLMVMSSVAYYFSSDGSSSNYRGHSFTTVVDDQGNTRGYTTKVNGKQLAFSSLPQESLDLTIAPGLIESMTNASIIVWIFDPNDNNTQVFDIFRYDMQQVIPNQQASAILAPSKQYQLPVLSCGNSTQGYPFIMLKHGTRAIEYSDGCYVLQGSDNDFKLLRDRILYRYYGITEN